MAQESDLEMTAVGAPPPPAATRTSRTNRNLWMAFVEEAKANRVYIAYAMRAVEEGHPEAAEVFWEVSGAETAHALAHLRVLGEVGATHDNLRRVIEEEMRRIIAADKSLIREVWSREQVRAYFEKRPPQFRGN